MRDLTIGEKVLHGPQDSKVPVILAADTICSAEHPRLLAKTILTWLSDGSQSRFITIYPLREQRMVLIHELWQRLLDRGLECIQEGHENGQKQWDDDVTYEWRVWRWRLESGSQESNLKQDGSSPLEVT